MINLQKKVIYLGYIAALSAFNFACKDASVTTTVPISVITAEPNMTDRDLFYQNIMNAAPFLPKDTLDKNISCPLPEIQGNSHTSSQITNYQAYNWEQRIAHDWEFFNIPESQGRILFIDIKQQNGVPVYRYLANNNTQNQLYEPWSSSKIFAFTAAMAQLRMQHSQLTQAQSVANGQIGKHYIADMITSINSYAPFANADGDSNALATFFANLATRDYLTTLFYDDWLKLSTPNIYFRGAYGPIAFEPSEYTWQSATQVQTIALNMNNVASLDPGYLPYQCDDCGLTGNKPMTTLAQAEWLKRLAMHTLDTSTVHPFITQSDVETLFYGTGHSQEKERFAGMTLGLSTMLQHAIAKQLNNNKKVESGQMAKAILDDASGGKWRVFQKIGWGPSETRSTTENVVLAYVCLPNAQDPRTFVVAAQVAVPEANDQNLPRAGLKMQALLDAAIAQYLQGH